MKFVDLKSIFKDCNCYKSGSVKLLPDEGYFWCIIITRAGMNVSQYSVCLCFLLPFHAE